MTLRSGSIRAQPKWWWVFCACLCIGLLAAAVLAPVAVASPPFYAMQALFRRFLYPLLAGEPSTRPFVFSFEVYFVAVFLAVGGLLVAFRRRVINSLPAGSYIGRAAKGLGLIMLVVYAANWNIQGGLGIPIALLYVVVLLVFWWELQRVEWSRQLTAAVVWIGAGFLLSSGAALPLLDGAPRFDLQRYHGIYGYLWLSALGAYLIDHIRHYEAKRETPARNRGYLAATFLSAAVLTGVARLHGGGATVASGLWVHVLPAVLAVGAVAFHVGLSLQRRGFGSQPGSRGRSPKFALGWLAVGALVPLLPFALAAPAPQATASADQRSLPDSHDGAGTADVHRGELPLALISESQAAVGCSRNGGCHVDTFAQWEHSAHRFSANAAYQRTVRLMIEEVGIEPARLCAGCHDPLPLLAGKIVEGSAYPAAGSEGITCVVCHSMRPGHERGNGSYTVEPSALFNDSVKDPFTAYMMIELYGVQHHDEFKPAALMSNDICAPCHNLTHDGLTLRRTFDEWSEGPFGPHRPGSKPCMDCHMPYAGRSYLTFQLHDHRMPAANVALANLRGEAGAETERRFISDALDLRATVFRQSSGALQLRLRLTNANGGHRFPTGPHDLLDYWFEVRLEGQDVDPEWRRLNAGSLFDEQLIARDGSLLTRHEIWRAVEKHGPEGIDPGATREYSFPLAEPSSPIEHVTVRLMHRRYQDAFLEFLGSERGGLYTDPVEVMRRSIDWRVEVDPGAERAQAGAADGAS